VSCAAFLPTAGCTSYTAAVRFVCERCGKKYHSADEPTPGHVYRMRCKVCGHSIIVAAPAAGGPAEPLPGAGTRGEKTPTMLPPLPPAPYQPVAPVPSPPFGGLPGSGTGRTVSPGLDYDPFIAPVQEADPFAAWHAMNSAAPQLTEAPGPTTQPPVPAPGPLPLGEISRDDADVTVEENLFRKSPARPKKRLAPLLAGGLALTAITGAAVVMLPQFLEQKPKVRLLRPEQLEPAGSTASNAGGLEAQAPPVTAAPSAGQAPPQAPSAPAGGAEAAIGSSKPPLASPASSPTAVETAAPGPAHPEAAPTGPVKVHPRGPRSKTRKGATVPEVARTEGASPAPEQAQTGSGADRVDLTKNKKDAPAPAPAAAPPAPRSEDVTGLTSQQVKTVLASQRKRFDACINEAIGEDPDFPFTGRKVGLFLTVNPSGVVSSPFLDDADVDDSPLGACLKVAGNKAVFPAFQGEPFQVRVPLAIRKVE
jgi:DNA-directed RNA polymerase subunit RPC12/RpoP